MGQGSTVYQVNYAADMQSTTGDFICPPKEYECIK